MISRNSSLDEIKNVLKECLNQLYNSDSFILEKNSGRGVCERSIVFRFAHYLQNGISNYFVDCDFNSSFIGYYDNNGELIATEREGKPIQNEDGTITKRFVDIIVHKRDYVPQNDFLCFEIKKWNNTNREYLMKDRNNLRILTSQYGYTFGFHIIIHKIKDETKWTIFQNGRSIEENVAVFR